MIIDLFLNKVIITIRIKKNNKPCTMRLRLSAGQGGHALQVVLKNGQVVTLAQSAHITFKSLKLTMEKNPKGSMAVDGIRRFLLWSDIDLEATEKLQQAATQGTS